MTLNYSKWDHIDISDDEDDTHPNVDTPSLFRWRHKARLDKMEEQKKEQAEFLVKYNKYQNKLVELQDKLKTEKGKMKHVDYKKVQDEYDTAVSHKQEWETNKIILEKKIRLTPLNIDTICKDSKSKTMINKEDKVSELSSEENYKNQTDFISKYEQEIKKYCMYQKYEDSRLFLIENPHLLCEYTSNYVVLWCLNLELEEKHELMKHVAHQAICMQFMLQLAEALNVSAMKCINGFFEKLKEGESNYLNSFNQELDSYILRIRKRAHEKIEIAKAEEEQKERENRLGPGGLDPVEVFESLPKDLQECFENKDMGMIQKVMGNMPPKEAALHLQRCIDSGMWIPNASDMENKED